LTACGSSDSQPASKEEPAGAAPAQEAPVVAAVAGDPAAGQELYAKTCVACHGPSGEGVQGLGKDMTSSEFIHSQSDQELVTFVKVGRDPSDPLNTTGVAMPSKGGNPALTDEDLQHIVAFIRTLQK
jgi:disulfide bond formation protein DsbB